jgi:ABC-type nitrate/sulfonate/bicarbonate transport system substrate-binding protein
LTSCLRVIVVSLLLIATAHAADPVRLGLLHTLSPAPFYIAQERGYFRDEGIDLTFRFFEAAQPIAAAAVSGDIDVGVTALTGGFFNLAEKGADRRRPARTTRLRGVRDPGFQQGVRGRPDLAG